MIRRCAMYLLVLACIASTLVVLGMIFCAFLTGLYCVIDSSMYSVIDPGINYNF